MNVRIHSRCGYPVSYSLVSRGGYSACCIKCDEDLFEFETELSHRTMATILDSFGSHSRLEIVSCLVCREVVLSWQLRDHQKLSHLSLLRDTPELHGSNF